MSAANELERKRLWHGSFLLSVIVFLNAQGNGKSLNKRITAKHGYENSCVSTQYAKKLSKKSRFYYKRGSTSKRATNSGAYISSRLTPGQQSYETSQWWWAVCIGNTVADLTDPEFEPQT